MHSKYFEQVKKFYNFGLYTKEQIFQFAEKNIITQEEANEIIGAALP